MKKLSTLIISLIILSLGYTQTASFTNAGGDNDWHNPQNWSTGQVPDFTITAIIPSDQIVIINKSVIAKSINDSGSMGIGSSNSIEILARLFFNAGTCETTP